MDEQEYLLLLLGDANLPTGSFVASAGLEAHAAHALLRASPDASADVLAFVRASVHTFASASLPFARDAHLAAAQNPDAALDALLALDALCEAGTLNHVARRASRAQGAALLTLYAKGFARPSGDAFAPLIDALKARVRAGGTPGHQAVCWGVLTAALGVTPDRAAHLLLFLHARALLSAAIRMGTVGPYAAQAALLHAVRAIVDDAIAQFAHLRTGIVRGDGAAIYEEEDDDDEAAFEKAARMPAGTWPLGELLQARHDQLHSRIFNS